MKQLAHLLFVTTATFWACGAPPSPTRPTTDVMEENPTMYLSPNEYPAGPCGGFAELEPGNPQSLIAGRLRVQVPGRSEDLPRPHNIMAAPPSASMESRLLLDHEGNRFVVFAVELFRTATDDLVAAASEDIGEGYSVEALAVEGPLRAVVAVPIELDLNDEAVDVATVYTATTDGMVQRVGFFVTPDAAESGGCRRLGLRSAQTLVQGERMLPDEPGPRVLEGTVGLDLPTGHRLVVQEGPDFTVYRVHPLLPLGDQFGTLGVYMGHHPTFRPPTEATGVAGELLGESVEWHDWTDDEDVHHRQTLVRVGGGSIHAHVFLGANDEAVFEALYELAGTLRQGVQPGLLAPCPQDAALPRHDPDAELLAIDGLARLLSAREFSVYQQTWEIARVETTAAFASVLQHHRAREAFLHLSLHGETAGRIYGLAGLSFVDRQTFNQVVCAVRETLDEQVAVRGACGIEQREVAELVEHPSGIRGQSHWSSRQWGTALREGEADLRGGGLGWRLALGPPEARFIAQGSFEIGGNGYEPPLSPSDTFADSLPAFAASSGRERKMAFTQNGGICRTRADGRVACWGTTPISERRGATLLPETIRWPSDIAVDLGLGCVLDADGRRACFALLEQALEARSRVCSDAPTPTEPVIRRFDDGPWRALGVAGDVCGIRPDGELHCFASSNEYLPEWAELTGVGIGTAYEVPVAGDVQGMASGHLFKAYAWTADGRIWRWDIDESPRVVGRIEGVTHVGAGNDGGVEFASTRDGRVFVRGAPRRQDGSIEWWSTFGDDEGEWIEISDLQGERVYIGDHHGCALSRGGPVRCWGQRTGYLPGAEGNAGYDTPPVDVPSLSGASSLLVGEWLTCAELRGGRYRCVGAHLDEISNGAVDEQARAPIVVHMDRIAQNIR